MISRNWNVMKPRFADFPKPTLVLEGLTVPPGVDDHLESTNDFIKKFFEIIHHLTLIFTHQCNEIYNTQEAGHVFLQNYIREEHKRSHGEAHNQGAFVPIHKSGIVSNLQRLKQIDNKRSSLEAERANTIQNAQIVISDMPLQQTLHALEVHLR